MNHTQGRYRWLCLGGVLSALLVFGFAVLLLGRTPGRPRAIILISIDTLRPDHLGVYGYSRPTSPFMDKFAETATVFEHATSTSSWTLPAHISLMVSRYSADHGVHTPQQRLRSGATTLAHSLRSAGYRTGGFYSSQLLSQIHGFAQGFDHYVRPEIENEVSPGAAINQAALAWIDGGQEPFFLFLHYFDVHAPYRQRRPGRASFADQLDGPNADYAELAGRVAERYLMSHDVDTSGLDWRFPRTGFGRAKKRLELMTDDPQEQHLFLHHYLLNRGLTDDEQKRVISLYDDGVAHQDFLIEQLAIGLEARGLLDDAMIWIVSDHGEMLYDHHGHRDHTYYLNQSVTAIPMIVRLPGQTAPRRVSSPPVSLVDVMPTILDMAGLEPFGQGTSLRRLLEGTGQLDTRSLPVQVAFDGTFRRSLLRWPWKLIIDDSGDQAERLYNLERDPNERNDVAEEHADLVDELAADLRRRTDVPGDLAATCAIEAEETEELRALGYLR
ncbi:MAG: hypothetical protein DRJ65_01660 [Acidobacteria bacterium]|nr:MAG: hypothetical protein DRJ65_01660 [Acidobacteriota bacterium]